jgi:prepilin-type N-terminal cleavage/methylation domain-containing protein
VYLLCLFNVKKIFHNRSNRGFTLVETLVVVVAIGILIGLGLPNWLAFVETRRLNTAQSEIYHAMRQAQSQAKKEKLTWQASFREHNGIVQWAVHPATVNPSAAHWNKLDTNVRLDEETTLRESDGIRQIQFDYRGSVKQPPLGRVTLSSKYTGKAKRCVYISTILGAIRMEKEHNRANSSGDYCY